MLSFCRESGMRLLRFTALLAVLSLLAPFALAIVSVVPEKGCEMACCKRSAAKDACHRTKHGHRESGPQLVAAATCGTCCTASPAVATAEVACPKAAASVALVAGTEEVTIAPCSAKHFPPIAFCLFQRPPPAC